VDVDLGFAEEEADAGAVEVGQFALVLGFDQGVPVRGAPFQIPIHVADAEMQGQGLDFGVLLGGRARPVGDVGVAGAVDHRFGFDADQAVLVGDDHGFDLARFAFHIADGGVEQDGETVLQGLKFAIKQNLEFKGVRDGRVVGFDVGGVRLANAGFGQQFQRDAFDHDAVVMDVGDAVEVGEPDAGDDATGERGFLDQ